ncbi:Oidioi.mRNA.OKI2018_I69.PAR.g9302.t1.cds [Oikopleura dioica]|uniref:Oidioi.mRNA.OKI2018_I69.PAR.g9302.t1.cds n=1 Tax=Oikopleura dioica TaxID=34765 RepID=A0ABN7RPH9_OIKDI|nr:Oidioi.mRNA.OKI2018_I69.PAR.g9302.t1.cds [Oikopleura dioica]
MRDETNPSSNGISQKEYESLIKEIAGKELTKKEQIQFFKPPAPTAFSRYYKAPQPKKKLSTGRLEAMARPSTHTVFRQESEWTKWYRIRQTSPQYDVGYSQFIANSVGIYPEAEKENIVRRARRYELNSASRERHRERILNRLEHVRKTQSANDANRTLRNEKQQQSPFNKNQRDLNPSLLRSRASKGPSRQMNLLEPEALSIPVDPFCLKRPRLPR